jgi:hypothetical protein
MKIDVSAYIGKCLLDRALLGTIQQVCRDHAPLWSNALYLWESKEGAPSIDLADSSALYNAVEFDVTTHGPFYKELVNRFGPPSDPRVCGTLEFRGADRSLTVVMTIDEHRFCRIGDIWTWGNHITFQLRQSRVQGVGVAVFAKHLFEDICARLTPWYARAKSADEFDGKNISFEGGGVQAVGVDISKSLPGLYWQNYFGGPCVESIGAERFEACNAFEKKRINDGYLLALGKDPRNWASAEYAATEREVMKTLGEDFFFLKSDPTRPTRSPFTVVPASKSTRLS